MRIIVYYIGVFCMLFHQSCSDFLEIDLPKDQLSRSNVFIEAKTAEAALNGMYALTQGGGGRMFTGGLTIYPGQYADELYRFTTSGEAEFLESKLTEQSDGILAANFWVAAYQYIYAANSCLEGVLESDLDLETKKMVVGEAYFMRSLAYYYLIELFGDVPLILTTDYQENEKIGRNPKQEVVKQILEDLHEASALLRPEYRDNFKNRPNRYAVQVLLSKVALIADNFELAFTQADQIIKSGMYRLEDSLQYVFLRESKETIFQFTRIVPTINTWEATFFVPATSNSSPQYVLQPDLVHSFSLGDKRRYNWIEKRIYNSQELFHPMKYRGRSNVLTEDYVLFRLAEQYLIRAEAALQTGRPEQAILDINVIRRRSGLNEINPSVSIDMLWEILLTERKHELFSELGHRWFDLKRLGKADQVLSPIKLKWKPSAVHWMIPWSQIRKNSLLTQNEGYE